MGAEDAVAGLPAFDGLNMCWVICNEVSASRHFEMLISDAFAHLW